MAKTNSIDMCSGPIFPKMLRFALPLMASSLLQLLFNAADIVVVGKFCGDASLAAVSSNGAMANLLVNLFIGLALGANVLAARFFGSKSDDELADTVHTSMLLSLIAGALATVVGLVFAPILLRLMNTPDNVLPLATLYLRIYFLGMIPLTVYNFGASLLRAIGDTKRPLYYLMAAGVLNVVLNLVFVVVFHLDVAGVAIATSLSQLLSAVLVVRCLLRESGAIRLDPKKLKINSTKLVQIIRVGLPAGIQGTLFSLSNVVIQSAINEFGDIVMAGNGAAANIEGFGYMAMNAFYQAVVSFTSQNFGQRRYKRIIKTQLIGQLCAISAGLLFSLVVNLFGRQLMWLYSDTEAAVAAGLVRLKYVGALYFLCGMMDILVGGLRGLGSSLVPMIVTLIGACGFRIVWVATVFRIPEYHMTDTVYFSYPVSWFITAVVQCICLIFVLRRYMKKYPPNPEDSWK